MRRAKVGRLAIGIVLVGAALTYLVYAGTSDNLVYYYEIDELMAAADTEDKIRISGDVVEGTVVRDDATRELRFAIQSSTYSGGGDAYQVPVVYSGTVPDIFQDGIQVVVEGELGEDGTFHAETLLAKCPSKYQAEGELS